jgi:hypothetical protein
MIALILAGAGTIASSGIGSQSGGFVAYGGNCSFGSSTVVWTPGGEVSIGQLQIYEQVLAYDPLTHAIEAQQILHVWEHVDADLVDVSIMPTTQSPVMFADTPEVIHTTSGHPFLTVEEGFIPVSQLRVGMHVMQANGNVGIVIAIRSVSGSMVMYNLDVAQDHTYIVGEDQWIVHNKCFY